MSYAMTGASLEHLLEIEWGTNENKINQFPSLKTDETEKREKTICFWIFWYAFAHVTTLSVAHRSRQSVTGRSLPGSCYAHSHLWHHREKCIHSGKKSLHSTLVKVRITIDMFQMHVMKYLCVVIDDIDFLVFSIRLKQSPLHLKHIQMIASDSLNR